MPWLTVLIPFAQLANGEGVGQTLYIQFHALNAPRVMLRPSELSASASPRTKRGSTPNCCPEDSRSAPSPAIGVFFSTAFILPLSGQEGPAAPSGPSDQGSLPPPFPSAPPPPPTR